MNPDELTDTDLHDFLVAVDAATGRFEVTDWEARFMEDNLERTSFTDAQRQSIHEMIEKYQDRLEGRW